MFTAAQQFEILKRRGNFHARRRPWLERMGLSVDDGGEDGGGAGGGDGDKGGESDKGGDGAPTVTPEEFSKLEGALKETRAELDRFRAKHSEAEKHRKAAEEAARKKAEEAARQSGDWESVEKSYQQKIADRDKAIAERDQMVQNLTAGQTASKLAGEIAVQGSAGVLERHIKDRLRAEIRDGETVTVVLGKDGKPTANTVEDLKQEFINDPAFAPIIVGSKAKGSGGPGNKPAGGRKTISQSEIDKMSGKQRAAFFAEHNHDVTVTD